MQKNRRTIILINKKFQLRFCLYVCSWVLALSFFYPLIINNLFTQLVECIGNQQVATGFAKTAMGASTQLRTQLLILIALLQIFFLIVMFIISLFMSHRIAGPIYKIRKFMEQARGGDFRSGLKFRDGDHFPELAEDYNFVMDAVRTILQQHNEAVRGVIAGLERSNDSAASDAVIKLKDLSLRLTNQAGEGDVTPVTPQVQV